jgi:hypothetical protein
MSQIIWIGVFQYCFIRVFFTVVSVVTQVAGRYCEASLNPAFAHVWVMCFEGASVTLAMYFLIQFYFQLRDDLAPYKPFLKLLCIKLVIFFSFWQTLVIGFLTSSGVIKPSNKMAYPDIKIGFGSMLLCIEMAIFAVLHVFAFSYKEYDISRNQSDQFAGAHPPSGKAYQGGRLGLKAFADAFNPWDIIKASARGFRWLFVGVRKRKQDRSYQTGTKLSKLDSHDQAYGGITFAGNGEQATEFTSGKKGEEDRAGLLSHAQNYGDAPSALSHGYKNNYSHGNGNGNSSQGYNPDRLPNNPTPAQEELATQQRPGPYAQNGGYGRMEPSPAPLPHPSQQNPYGGMSGAGAANNWNMFGGLSNQQPPRGPSER